MNEKEITCHDCHGFKWQKINILSNFDCFSLWSNVFFGSLDCEYTHDYAAHGHI
jgi:hypothetical protein